MGIGTAALLVASFSGAQKAALESQNVSPDDVYSVISGIWTSTFALGNFIGPTLGGFLVDGMGFRQTTAVFQLIGGVMLILDLINVCCFNLKKKKHRRRGRRSGDMHLRRVKSNSSTVKVDLYERMP